MGTMLDGAFPMAMDEDGTLLGLFGRVAADVDEGLDDVVEGVDVVVVQNKVASGVFEDIGIVLRLGGYFGRFHFIDYVFRCGSMLEGGVR